MPLKKCSSGGKSGWKWGDAGKCYTGPSAKKKALAQATAMGEFEKSDAKTGVETMDRNDIKKEMTEEEFWTLELRRIDISVTELLNEADNVVNILNEMGVVVPDVPVLTFINKSATEEEEEVNKEEEKKEFVLPGRGKRFAEIAFVGASPAKVDVIRNRPFSAMVGKTLSDLYLGPLGLSVDDVYLTNIVKEHCVDENGVSSDPTNDQIKASWNDFVEEMNHVQPRYIVALGKTARNHLSDVAVEWAPHPRAINMLGDSGEVGRKMSRLKKKMDAPDEVISGTVIKSVDEKQIVYGVVMEPLENDTDENWTTSEEIADAAHFFMKNFRLIDTEHGRVDIDAVPVESWVQHEDTVINGEPVKAGSWVMGVKVEGDKEWERVSSGEYSGFSIDAFARIAPNLELID